MHGVTWNESNEILLHTFHKYEQSQKTDHYNVRELILLKLSF